MLQGDIWHRLACPVALQDVLNKCINTLQSAAHAIQIQIVRSYRHPYSQITLSQAWSLVSLKREAFEVYRHLECHVNHLDLDLLLLPFPIHQRQIGAYGVVQNAQLKPGPAKAAGNHLSRCSKQGLIISRKW